MYTIQYDKLNSFRISFFIKCSTLVRFRLRVTLEFMNINPLFIFYIFLDNIRHSLKLNNILIELNEVIFTNVFVYKQTNKENAKT